MELMMAVQSGSLQEVKRVIASSKIPLDDQWLDYAALNNAVELGHILVAEYLLSIGCRVNMDEELDLPINTPLHHAVMLEDTDLVEKLLEKKARILDINPDENSSLHLAFLIKNDKITDMLLDALLSENNLTNVKNGQGLSHMHIACTRKHSKAVECFVASGVDLNDCVDEDATVYSGYSALHFAIEFRSINAVKAILNSSASTYWSIEDAVHNLTPLSLAQRQLEDLSAITELLTDKKVEDKDCMIIEDKGMEKVEEFKGIREEEKVKGIKEMEQAKGIKEAEELKPIVEKKVSFENSSTGLTTFHMACMENNPSVVEYLIANGASVHQPVISHIDLFHLYTPLHLAVENKCKRTVEILLKHGADVNLQNQDRMTPLHLALYVNEHDDKQPIVDYLYAAVASKLANPKDANGLSYLHVACTRNDTATVTHLLDIGEDVDAQVARNSRNVPNFTPLHFAVRYENEEVAKLLIERGANVDRYSLEGTPLHLACRQRHSRLVGLLLDSGAKVDGTMRVHSLIEMYAGSKDAKVLEYVDRMVRLGVDVDAKDECGNTALHVACLRKEMENCARFLLDLGANVNLENREDRTAFEVAGDSIVLYHHVQELKALGVEVSAKNEARCREMLSRKFSDEETLERKRQQRIDEITCMKSIKLNKSVALDDFLRLDPDHADVYADNEIIRLVVSTKDLIKFFPTYAYLVKLQYCRAVGSFGSRKKKEIDWEGSAREAKRQRL